MCGQMVFVQVHRWSGCQSTCGHSALLCVWLCSSWWLRLWVSKRNGTEIEKESNTDVEVKIYLYDGLTNYYVDLLYDDHLFALQMIHLARALT